MARELSRELGVPNVGPLSTKPPLFWLLALLSLVPLCMVLPMAPLKFGIGAMAGWILLLWVAIAFVRRQFHYAIPLWVAFYPYCYYFLTFPRERSIFTLDRAFVLLLVIEMLIVSRYSFDLARLTQDVRISAYFWGLFLFICFLSLAVHATSHELAFYRLLVEGMLMPAVLGLYMMRYFPLLKDLNKLHLSTCILGFGLCVTGLVELTTNIDLFPWQGSEPMFTDTHLRRADGPFEQQIVLSVVAILAFFFIIYLRRLMPERISPWRAIIHQTGCVASLGASLLPLNRGLVFALAPIAVIEAFSKHRLISRRIWATFFATILLAALAAKLLDPPLYEDRVSSPDNAYQRVAQHMETLRVVRNYPFFGVGFNLYHDVASQNPQYMAKWRGIESMNFPHNVLMTVLSEEGIFGLAFYMLAQAFLFRAMWKIRQAFPAGWLAFLYCFLIYVLTGLDFAIVSFSDINLFYILILATIYQYQIRIADEKMRSAETGPYRTVYA
jgi:O-Antigen ligase